MIKIIWKYNTKDQNVGNNNTPEMIVWSNI